MLSKEYQWLWEQLKAEGKKLASAKKAAQVAIDNRARYETVAEATNAPWFSIAVIHYREASQSWNGCLHNGDPWNKVTQHVPAGRGPWKSWDDAAVDALQFEGYANLHDWTLGDVFRRLEGYNGFGYRAGGVKNFTCHRQRNRAGNFDGIYHGSMQDTTPRNSSPYVYNGTPFYEKGISIEDHSFYPEAVDDNVGVMFFLKVLEGLSGGPLFPSSGLPPATASTHALATPQAAAPPIASAIPEPEVLAILKALAARVDVPAANIDRMFDLQMATRPGRIPRFSAACDFRKRSDRQRFHIFDRVANTVTSHLCAHGQGSEDKDHDGKAVSFSNVSGSNQSSLGIYRCAETYVGKHGTSLRIDGLEPSNSNARQRDIVVHSAPYVSAVLAAKNGGIGCSNGCFAFSEDEAPSVIQQLEGGSLIVAFD